MSDDLIQKLENTVRTVPNFPIEGVLFRDITPVLGEPGLLSSITDRFSEDLERLGWTPDVIVGPEARGFIFGPLLAERIGCAFVPVRKPGKLPHVTLSQEYSLEYGSNTLEIHEDAIRPGQQAVIIDDLLATGGTISACTRLCQACGASVIGAMFLIELDGLGARDTISPIQVHSLLTYPA